MGRWVTEITYQLHRQRALPGGIERDRASCRLSKPCHAQATDPAELSRVVRDNGDVVNEGGSRDLSDGFGVEKVLTIAGVISKPIRLPIF